MEHFLEEGQLTGKITCPNKKCAAKLGNYDWAGVGCGCKQWVTPVRCRCLFSLSPFIYLFFVLFFFFQGILHQSLQSRWNRMKIPSFILWQSFPPPLHHSMNTLCFCISFFFDAYETTVRICCYIFILSLFLWVASCLIIINFFFVFVFVSFLPFPPHTTFVLKFTHFN